MTTSLYVCPVYLSWNKPTCYFTPWLSLSSRDRSACHGGCLPAWWGGVPACTEADPRPREQNSWHTPMKILPWSNFVAAGNYKGYTEHLAGSGDRLPRLQYLDISVNFVGDPNMPNILSWEDVRIEIQWRIQDFSRGGAPTSKVDRRTYFFGRKLHENERILAPRRGARPWAHPLDPPLKFILRINSWVFIIGLFRPLA